MRRRTGEIARSTSVPIMPPTALRLGTRRSALALAQSRIVAAALEAGHPGLAIELVPVATEGDRLRGSLADRGGKGLFTRELEEGLLASTLDLAVHSLKDLPTALPAGLRVAAFPERADPRDVLVSDVAASVGSLPEGALILTGSLRRRAQLLRLRPDLRVEAVRGNVDTRLRKWRERRAAGLVLAAAGLARLGFDDLPARPLEPAVMLPAPGQGTLAVEIAEASPAGALCAGLDHPASRRAAEAERGVVAAFGGDCTLPLAAWARADGVGRLRLTALLLTPDGDRWVAGEAEGTDPAAVAADCVRRMQDQGAAEVLAAVR